MEPLTISIERKRSDRNRKAFTLIELVVVIIVIGVLAGLVAPRLLQNVGKAKTNAAHAQIEMLGLALDNYRLDNDYYPTTDQGIDALIREPDIAPFPNNWDGPYLKKLEVPMDPWDRPYIYRSPGEMNLDSYDIYTLGRDGIEGGEGEDQDVYSWE
jgi:general secretion pathway protein G